VTASPLGPIDFLLFVGKIVIACFAIRHEVFSKLIEPPAVDLAALDRSGNANCGACSGAAPGFLCLEKPKKTIVRKIAAA
jgi:hypothetical protein